MDASGGMPKNCSNTAAPAYRLMPMWMSIADMMNMKERGAHDGPLQIAASEEVGLAGVPVDLAHRPQADEQDAQQVDDDDEEIDGRDGHRCVRIVWARGLRR